MKTQSEYTALLESRKHFYRLLARLYKTEVDQALFDLLSQTPFAADSGNEEMDAGYRLIDGFLGRPPLAALTVLASDYARIFIGAGASKDNAAAYPYESVYTSPGRLLMQDARDQVLAAYRARGLEREASFPVPEDHIALELEFMGHLGAEAQRRAASGDEAGLAACLEEQRGFLKDHLLRWSLEFCEDVRKFAATDFYRGVSRLTDGFLLMDRDLLDELVRETAAPDGGDRPAPDAPVAGREESAPLPESTL